MTTNPANKIRVCSYSIHKGFSAINTRYLLKEIRHAIALVDADVVFLQEVVGENLGGNHCGDMNSMSDNYLEFLTDSIGKLCAEPVELQHCVVRKIVQSKT